MDRPSTEHRRPDGVDDNTVQAVDTFTRALETIEVARGHLLQWHRLTGTGDTQLTESVAQLRASGHDALADRVETELVGRNVIDGRWTFQVVEEYDDGYYADWKAMEHDVRHELVEGKRHLFEAEMKEDRRTHGRRDHTAVPPTKS